MNITELIQNELAKSNEPDPHKIARKLLNKINNDQIQELLWRGMTELVTEQIRFSRAESNYGPVSEGYKVGPSRRSIAIQERVRAKDEWKMLVDCNVNDLEVITEGYRKRTQQMAEKTQYYELLAEELKDSGYATVGEMWREQESAMVA